MDEEVLQDLYSRAQSKGYTKSFEDFVVLIQGDTDVQNDMFSYVQEQGYQKNIEDFQQLIGVKKKDSDLPVQEEVTESITEVETPDTSLVSSESLIFEEEPSQEKDTLIERTFGKNVVTDFLGDLYRSATQGLGQAQTVDDALEIFTKGSTATDEDLTDYIKAIQESESYQETDEMRDFYKTYQEEGEGLFGVLKGIGENPSILPQILTSSIFSMFNPAVAAGAGAGAGAGALTGAAAGAIGGPLAAITAGGGAVAGMIGGATTTLETALTFNELLKEELGGLPFTKENVRAVLNDPEKLSRLRNRAAGRGAAIGTVDAITGGLAGKATTAVLGKTARKVTQAGAKKLGQGSRLAATGTGLGVEAVGGSLGEVAGKAVAGQEMDVADIALEAVAGLGSAPITLGRSLFSNQPIYTINGVEKTKQEMQEIIKDMTDEDIASSKAKIIINNDPVTYNLLKDKLDNYTTKKKETESVQEVEEEAVIKDSQIPTSKEIYTLETEEGEGVRTVEITINKDGSRTVVQKVDGNIASSERLSKDNTLSNKEYVENAYDNIVGEPQILPMEEVMNPKMKEKLTTQKKQELGIDEEGPSFTLEDYELSEDLKSNEDFVETYNKNINKAIENKVNPEQLRKLVEDNLKQNKIFKKPVLKMNFITKLELTKSKNIEQTNLKNIEARENFKEVKKLIDCLWK